MSPSWPVRAAARAGSVPPQSSTRSDRDAALRAFPFPVPTICWSIIERMPWSTVGPLVRILSSKTGRSRQG
jgi:hypothetical protein